jgi:hypothetical protein
MPAWWQSVQTPLMMVDAWQWSQVNWVSVWRL